MEDKVLYTISLKGLSIGSHVFDWTIDKSFFALYEMSEISDSSINARLTLVKHRDFLELNFAMKGWAEVTCDRCLDPLRLDTASEAKMFVKFDDHAGEDESDDNDVIILPYGEDRLNVAQYLYEYAHLNLPLRKVHSDQNLCNAEMINKLEQFLVKN